MDSAIDLFRNALVIKRLKIRDQGLYIHSYDKEYIEEIFSFAICTFVYIANDGTSFCRRANKA